jgi:hypothetical protein
MPCLWMRTSGLSPRVFPSFFGARLSTGCLLAPQEVKPRMQSLQSSRTVLSPGFRGNAGDRTSGQISYARPAGTFVQGSGAPGFATLRSYLRPPARGPRFRVDTEADLAHAKAGISALRGGEQ